MKYPQRIRELRENNNKKQAEIAKIIKISQQYYSQYELGKRPLPIEHLTTLCKYYNVSADYILGFTNKIKELPKDENLMTKK